MRASIPAWGCSASNKEHQDESVFLEVVQYEVSTTTQQAEALAKAIESGEIVPVNQHGERFYKLGGWCYDVGRKPFLVQYTYGHIERHWAMSVAELRKACRLGANDRVAADPFWERTERGVIPTATAA